MNEQLNIYPVIVTAEKVPKDARVIANAGEVYERNGEEMIVPHGSLAVLADLPNNLGELEGVDFAEFILRKPEEETREYTVFIKEDELPPGAKVVARGGEQYPNSSDEPELVPEEWAVAVLDLPNMLKDIGNQSIADFVAQQEQEQEEIE